MKWNNWGTDRDLFKASQSHKCLHGVMVKAVGILCSNCVFTARKFAMVMFLQVCVCPRGGGMRGRGVVMHGRGACVVGACLAGGMCGRGEGMRGRGHAWQGANMWQGGMCGRGHVWWGGACVAGGACMAGHMCATPPLPPTCDTTRYGRSMHGWYASYWNAFLFQIWFYFRLHHLIILIAYCRVLNWRVDHTKRKREKKRSRSKNKRQTSKKNFTFAFVFARSEHSLRCTHTARGRSRTWWATCRRGRAGTRRRRGEWWSPETPFRPSRPAARTWATPTPRSWCTAPGCWARSTPPSVICSD